LAVVSFEVVGHICSVPLGHTTTAGDPRSRTATIVVTG
jgi:hypothetical protein